MSSLILSWYDLYICRSINRSDRAVQAESSAPESELSFGSFFEWVIDFLLFGIAYCLKCIHLLRQIHLPRRSIVLAK